MVFVLNIKTIGQLKYTIMDDIYEIEIIFLAILTLCIHYYMYNDSCTIIVWFC